MSDERPTYARWRYPNAGIEGKKILTVEFFEARHWRLKAGMPVYPSRIAATGVNLEALYRLRVNGRWFGHRRLSFFSMVEAAAIVERILKIKDVNAVEKEIGNV